MRFKPGYCEESNNFGWRLWRVIVAGALASVVLSCVLLAAFTDKSVLFFSSALVISVTAGVLWIAHYYLMRLCGKSHSSYKSAKEAEEHYITVLQRVINAAESRDDYTVGHSERVGKMAMQLAEKMDLPAALCKKMEIAGYLHDIGMIAIPENLLASSKRLSASDFRLMQKHSQIGYEVLLPLESLADVLPGVRYHHERMNGTGYPAGLKENDIPIEARILAVVDAYDAMTHDRPYRNAMTPINAFKELRRCTPAGYDTQCVDNLGKMLHLDSLEEVNCDAE